MQKSITETKQKSNPKKKAPYKYTHFHGLNSSEFIGTVKLSQLVKRSVDMIRRYAIAGKIPCIRFNRDYLFHSKDVPTILALFASFQKSHSTTSKAEGRE